jgi:hypothetical protein
LLCGNQNHAKKRVFGTQMSGKTRQNDDLNRIAPPVSFQLDLRPPQVGDWLALSCGLLIFETQQVMLCCVGLGFN